MNLRSPVLHTGILSIRPLTRKVFGFEQRYMYEILVTRLLGTSEGAGECHFSAHLCKRAVHVTVGVTVEATCNADILTINASAL